MGIRVVSGRVGAPVVESRVSTDKGTVFHSRAASPNREGTRLRRTVTEIAKAEGIGRTLASREANSPGCRQLVAEFVSDERDEMCALFYRSLRAIDLLFSSSRLSVRLLYARV